MGVIFFNAGGRYEFKADIDLKLFVRKMDGTGENFFYRNLFNYVSNGSRYSGFAYQMGKIEGV